MGLVTVSASSSGVRIAKVLEVLASFYGDYE